MNRIDEGNSEDLTNIRDNPNANQMELSTGDVCVCEYKGLNSRVLLSYLYCKAQLHIADIETLDSIFYLKKTVQVISASYSNLSFLVWPVID